MTKSSKRPEAVVKDIYTIDEFCRMMSIGKSLYYKLRLEKKLPRLMKIGRAVRISSEAIMKWRMGLEGKR